MTGFYSRGRECSLRGTDWVFKSDGYSFVLKGLIMYESMCRCSYDAFHSMFYLVV